MRNARGQVIGVFEVLNKQGGAFTPLDEQLLASLSSHAAVAIEKAQLYDEVQRAYAQLQSLDRLKSEFLSTISHELRTPLSPIIGYADILLSGTLGELPAASRRGVEAIAESARRLFTLIESLLVFIRLDQGEMTLTREPVEILPLVLRVIDNFQHRALERRLDLVCEGPDILPLVLADPKELSLALTHLVDNATKFTPAGGRIAVRARPVSGEDGTSGVELAVQDTGIGIPKDLHAMVFERFYQVDGSLKRQYGGAGIGLAVVKQIIEAHGSRIHLDSEPGRGATFRFLLPTAG
jgi:two-component system phosphate regulon sensor histidine kinase PhoR